MRRRALNRGFCGLSGLWEEKKRTAHGFTRIFTDLKICNIILRTSPDNDNFCQDSPNTKKGYENIEFKLLAEPIFDSEEQCAVSLEEVIPK